MQNFRTLGLIIKKVCDLFNLPDKYGKIIQCGLEVDIAGIVRVRPLNNKLLDADAGRYFFFSFSYLNVKKPDKLILEQGQDVLKKIAGAPVSSFSISEVYSS